MGYLWNRHTNRLEPAEILDRIEDQDVECFYKHWLPPMQVKLAELKYAGKLNRESVRYWNVEDAHWGWSQKVQERRGQLSWSSYAIRRDGLTQGLMFVNLNHRCRLPSQLNEHMVYVDLVSTAPWNRPRFATNPLYGGVGRVLVIEAIVRSLDEEFGGRIGLHSLPGAEELYRDKLGMECLGPDAGYGGLPYYEFTPQRAAPWLADRPT